MYHFLKPTLFLISICFLMTACKKERIASPQVVTDLQGLSQVTDAEGNTYRVGYTQVTSINQDPFVEKKNAAGAVVWHKTYESTAVDGRATRIALDEEDKPWVVFTVDGGSTADAYITKKEVEEGAFTGVFLPGYGRGGGAKVCIVAQLNPSTGKITKGTFLMSRTNEGNFSSVEKTNSLSISLLGIQNGEVIVEGNSWFLPPAVTATASNFTHHPNATADNKTGNSWRIQIALPKDLSKLNSSTIIPPQ